MKASWKQKSKRTLAILFTGLLLYGQGASGLHMQNAFGADIIGDASQSWAEPYLLNLYEKGIMRGDQEGNLNPDRNITRAEFISMINRSFGYNSFSKAKLPFRDVQGTEWFADDLAIAYEEGYFSGINKNEAGPNESLTREQAVALLCRNLKIPEIPGENLKFQDSRNFPKWSSGSINAASEKGIVSGYSDNTFRPSNSITRGEAAKMFTDAIGELISSPSSMSFGTTSGNVTITSSGVTLKDTVVNGDLYITNGVGTGYINLENVTVLGQVIISGCGESNEGDASIILNGTTITDLIIDGPEDKLITLKSEGSSKIVNTIVKSDSYIEDNSSGESGFDLITQEGGTETQLHLAGDFNKVIVKNPKSEFALNRGTIRDLTIDEDAPESTVLIDEDSVVDVLNLDVGTEVTGLGDIGTANVNAEDVTIEQLPDNIVIRPGVIANINGQDMTSKGAQQASEIPRILSSYPEIDEISPSGGTATFKTNKAGTIVWAITLEEDDDISTDDIKKPAQVKEIVRSGSFSIDKGEEEKAIKVTGLRSDTDYTLTAVLVDARDDTSSKKKENFTTTDNTVPAFVSGYPVVSASTNTTADIEVITNKDCSVYWAVLPVGRITPTAEELKKEKINGTIDSGSTKNLKKNEAETIKVSNLKEAVKYDFYIMASDGINDSKVTALNFTTMDQTAPEFLAGYPKMDKITEKSVDVKYNINEAGTVYFVVCKKGTDFPAPIPPATTSPSLDSEEAKQAVITGNNAYKSGKSTTQGNNEGTLKLTGLEPETAYDLYVVAQDQAKNASSVAKLNIKTTDIVPPTATQEFSQIISNNPSVDSVVTIRFSEEVWDDKTLKPLDKENLANNITLYDMSADRITTIPLDFTNAVVSEDEEGKTIVILDPSVTNLKSGNDYQFELNGIIDTSNNRMGDKTKLPAFSTVPPLVELAKSTADDDMDMTFELYPQSTETNANVLFDIVFESNANVEFDLYRRNNDEPNFDALTEFSNYYHPFVRENESITLHYIMDRGLVPGSSDYTFEPFNGLKDYEKIEFGIRVRSVDGVTKADGLNKTVKFKIKCVTGSKTNLAIVAGDSIRGLETALQEGAKLVNYPEDFQVMATFTDTVIPKFEPGYPKVTELEGAAVGDTAAYPLVRTDKKATFYYLIAPEGKVVGMPNSLDIMNNAIKPQGGFIGSYNIESGNTEFEVPITDLVPNTKYEIFYFLKGTPRETSPVEKKTFDTRTIAAPNVSLNVVDRGDDFAMIAITVDKDCTIDWIMFPSKQSPPLDLENPSSVEHFKKIIRNGAETTSYVPVDFKSVKATLQKGQSTTTIYVTVKGIKRNEFYTFYAVANGTYGGGDSDIAVLSGITPTDSTPPTVEVSNIIGNQSASGQKYEGSIILTFSEPLFYIPQEDSTVTPLTKEILEEQLKDTGDESAVHGGGTAKINSYSTKPVTMDDGTVIRSLSSVEIGYSGMVGGSIIEFGYDICDKSGNRAGKLYMRFVDREYSSGRGDSGWEVTFLKEDD